MTKSIDKPSAEAKALSLYLMAHKSTSNSHKEKSKRMNRIWGLVQTGEMDKNDYLKEVKTTLDSYGGYDQVVENTVKFYINKTGKWTLQGDDKYCKDAAKVANKLVQNN